MRRRVGPMMHIAPEMRQGAQTAGMAGELSTLLSACASRTHSAGHCSCCTYCYISARAQPSLKRCVCWRRLSRCLSSNKMQAGRPHSMHSCDASPVPADRMDTAADSSPSGTPRRIFPLDGRNLLSRVLFTKTLLEVSADGSCTGRAKKRWSQDLVAPWPPLVGPLGQNLSLSAVVGEKQEVVSTRPRHGHSGWPPPPAAPRLTKPPTEGHAT